MIAKRFYDVTSSSLTTSAVTRPWPCAARHPIRRRQALLPAALQSRSQPHRASLRQAQDPAAKGQSTNRRRNLAPDRLPAPRLLPSGMRKLLQKLRICVNLTGSDSRAARVHRNCHTDGAIGRACTRRTTRAKRPNLTQERPLSLEVPVAGR